MNTSITMAAMALAMKECQEKHTTKVAVVVVDDDDMTDNSSSF